MSKNQRREEALRELERELKSRDRAEKTKPLGVVAASVAVILCIVGGIWWATTSGSGDEETTASSSTESTAPETNFEPVSTKRPTALPETVTCTYNDAEAPAREVSKPATENISTKGTVDVELDTSAGKIGMTLDRSVSPCTVNAIEHMAKEKYFDDTICHRLTNSGLHVLQCGDPSGTGRGGPGFQFPNEHPTDSATQAATVNYGRGTIAMANAGKDTNGSQFFLNYGDSPLPTDYTYFGQINDEGLKTLDAIAEAGVKDGAPDGPPAKEVKIKTAVVK